MFSIVIYRMIIGPHLDSTSKPRVDKPVVCVLFKISCFGAEELFSANIYYLEEEAFSTSIYYLEEEAERRKERLSLPGVLSGQI